MHNCRAHYFHSNASLILDMLIRLEFTIFAIEPPLCSLIVGYNMVEFELRVKTLFSNPPKPVYSLNWEKTGQT